MTYFFRNFCCFFVGLLLGVSSEARQTAHHSPSLHGSSVALTVTGGVSLGSYEAGFLYYLSRFSQLNHLFKFPIITGASAGAINSFLMGIDQCNGADAQEYEDSLFWKFWIPIGLQKLTRSNSESPHALFSRTAIDDQIKMVKKVLKNSNHKSCSSTIGISLTRKKPLSIRITDELSAPKLSEILIFQMTQNGSEVAFKNINLRSSRPHQFVLPLTGDFDHDFDRVAQAIAASTAFPVAFEPEKIRHCLQPFSSPYSLCTDESSREEEFIDGGFYDNQPLRATAKIAQELGHKDTLYLLVDPTSFEYPKIKDTKKEDMESLTPYLLKLGGSLVDSARRNNITRLIEDDPSISQKIIHSTARLPLNSSGLNAFVGFFESDFRKMDFIYGMYEARRLVLSRTSPHRISKFPENRASPSWKRFRCISQILDGTRELGSDCKDFEDEKNLNTLILLQVSLDRLYHSCRDVKEPLSFSLSHCREAQSGMESPRLLKNFSAQPPNDLFEDGSDFAHFFKLLGNYRFEFQDLKLDRDESDHALQRINQETFRFIKKLANKQQQPESILLKIVSKPLVDSITMYTPPGSLIYLNFGTSQEVGFSQMIYRKEHVPSIFRYHFGARTQGVLSLFSQSLQFSVTPLVGIEVDLVGLNSSVTQFRLGLQAGRQFGNRDGWGSQSCTPGTLSDSGWACSAWVVDPALIVTFLDRFRLQAEGLLYPFSSPTPPFQLTLQVGYQFLLD